MSSVQLIYTIAHLSSGISNNFELFDQPSAFNLFITKTTNLPPIGDLESGPMLLKTSLTVKYNKSL